MKKSVIWTICGVLSALVLSLVLWRVLTPPERELLQVCWNTKGEAVYVSNMDDGNTGSCVDAQDLVWDTTFPLSIAVKAYKDDLNTASLTIIDAAKDFNKFAGWNVFDTRWLVCEKGCKHNVVIEWSAPYEEGQNSAGSVSHTKDKDGMKSIVKIRTVNTLYSHAVLLHELGHVVGLKHAPAEDRINIMEAKLPHFSEDNIDLQLGLRKLAPEDKELLKNTYKK